MAIGAASIDNAVESLLPSGVPIQIPSVQDQINTFKNEHPRYSLSTTRNDDIAALFVSTVDYLANIIRLMHNTTAPIKYATIVSDGILTLLDQLKEIGFKNIYVGNMAAFQYTPLVKTLKIQAVTKTSVDLANQMIRDKTAAWAKANSIGLFDIADLGKFVEVTQGSSAIASALGLTNIEDACVGGELRRLFQDGNLVQHLIDLVINLDEVLMCRSPTEYYFFDSVHPSERMHRLFGYFTYEAITAQRSGSTFSLNEANIISVIQKYSLNSAAPKPASL
ncbi:hypothetical protein FBU59_000235 [Linderina macrospora]|uniref:Uncharacterized protein n=1 Tax=Linderina macrospora TaxID=4868 RepID=A0ACC1JH86_9FUNG|nr:hypothetical protein FBU59_000235 [Linderina macrospora]